MSQYMPAINPSDIAVVGFSGRFPGARDVREFWSNLCNQAESRTLLSDADLADAGIDEEMANDPDYVRAAYLLKDADRFDAAFFGYSPREARFMDPQQRVLLECAWEATEHAGYGAGSQRTTGVYVGSSLNTYLLFTGLASQFKTEPILTLMSNDKDFLATRIAYKLQLEGPCVTVQTACSTSLVAVHMACQSILSGECEMALAGGVCVKVPLKAGYLYREGGMLSRDGHCRAFDAAATGTIFGSGAGIVVLKRYADALLDGDTVHAVIKATSINNDGARKASYTAPSVTGLAEVIEQSLDFAQLRADQISHVECHGTGTALGDPIEVHALTRAFRASTERENYCSLASVKSNIGHLESASGIAGLIKVICCLRNRYLPATLHFRQANPALALEGSPFFVNGESREWQSEGAWRVAAVNSLGVGGTNANVIVAEAPPKETELSRRKWHFLPISGKNREALACMKTDLVGQLAQNPAWQTADAAYTLQTGRKSWGVRQVLLLNNDRDQIVETSETSLSSKPRPIVFLFGERFDDAAAESVLQEEPQWGALAQSGASTSDRQVALATLWKNWGVQASAHIGVGVGINAATLVAANIAPLQTCADSTDLPAFCRQLLDCWTEALFLPLGSVDELWSTLRESIGKSRQYTLIDPLDGSAPIPSLLSQTAALWSAGCQFAGAPWYRDESRGKIPLPTTPFHGDRHWWEPASKKAIPSLEICRPASALRANAAGVM